jgi:hypothetical protein
MWRDLVSTLYADAKFREPASPAAIEAMERELHVAIPDDLKALLTENDNREWFVSNLEDYFRRSVARS